MKTSIVRFLFAAMSLAAALPVSAQVFEFDVFKTTVYHQTDTNPPVQPDFPNAFFFASKMLTDTNFDITNITVETPVSSFMETLTSPGFYTFNTPYFAVKTNLDTAFPSGEYDFFVDYLDAFTNSQQTEGSVTIPDQDLNNPFPAAFTPDCWTAMQQVNAGQDFILAWNPYAVTPGADTAGTFLTVQDDASGAQIQGIINTNGTPEGTNALIPAGSLLPGHSYTVNISFSERNTNSGTGFNGAVHIVGFDNLTYTSLITVAGLQIIGAGTNVILTWPTAATMAGLQLQTAVQADTPSANWQTVTDQPTISGSTNVLELPAPDAQRFFRLGSPPGI